MRIFGPEPLFRDRRDAGGALAARLERYRGRDPLVLGLPRGGVVVAAEVARRLDAELDAVVPRRRAVPAAPGFATAGVPLRGERLVVQVRLRDVQFPDQLLVG